MEEFIAGREFGGDAIVMDGKLAFVAITEKHLDQFVVTGHCFPSTLAREDQLRVAPRWRTAVRRLAIRAAL